jgi:threonyl-tRNA synthetase
LAFLSKEELTNYLKMREEAEKRDHKVLGKKLGLFTFSPEVGSGLPLYMPKGNIVREELLKYITELKEANNYKFVWTPHLAKKALYIRSGHLGKYDAMLPAIKTDDGEEFILKPMNCPHHFQIYNAEPRSYKDLPFRIAENATDYRNEKSGELNGLFRVRSLTQDDTHHIIRHDQISSEIDMILSLTRDVYDKFAFKNFRVEISVRDPKNKTAYFGTDDMWNDAENALIDAAKRWGAPFKISEGEAAFYGPKIDIRVEDALGRTWQLTTVQLDYNQPENFDMTYIDENGKKVRPAVIHAALLGSVDRFMGIIIEQFAGAFPAWLAPTQATILAIGDKFSEYGKKVHDDLAAHGIRTEWSEPTESLNKRIRGAEMMRIPYIVVVGEKEATDGTVAIRIRKDGSQVVMKLDEFISKIEQEVKERTS